MSNIILICLCLCGIVELLKLIPGSKILLNLAHIIHNQFTARKQLRDVMFLNLSMSLKVVIYLGREALELQGKHCCRFYIITCLAKFVLHTCLPVQGKKIVHARLSVTKYY